MSLSRDLRPYFFCLAKRNRGKKRLPHTSSFAFPVLLIKQGVCGTRFAQTVLDENSLLDCVARRGARGLKVKTKPCEFPLSSFRRERSEPRNPETLLLYLTTLDSDLRRNDELGVRHFSPDKVHALT